MAITIRGYVSQKRAAHVCLDCGNKYTPGEAEADLTPVYSHDEVANGGESCDICLCEIEPAPSHEARGYLIWGNFLCTSCADIGACPEYDVLMEPVPENTRPDLTKCAYCARHVAPSPKTEARNKLCEIMGVPIDTELSPSELIALAIRAAEGAYEAHFKRPIGY